MRFEWGRALGWRTRPYLIRWAVIVKALFSTRLHWWRGSDDHRHMHDHQWWFCTFVLWGSYIDHSLNGSEVLRAGSVRFRDKDHRHWVEVRGRCLTLVITGREQRRSGFWVDGKRIQSNKYFFKYGHHSPDGTAPQRTRKIAEGVSETRT